MPILKITRSCLKTQAWKRPLVKKSLRSISVICVTALLTMTSGCVVTLPMVFSTTETLSSILTGKGATDNVLSGITGEDCVIHRKFVSGEDICEPIEEEPEVVEETVE